MFAGTGELQYYGLQSPPGRPLHAGGEGRGPGTWGGGGGGRGPGTWGGGGGGGDLVRGGGGGVDLVCREVGGEGTWYM